MPSPLSESTVGRAGKTIREKAGGIWDAVGSIPADARHFFRWIFKCFQYAIFLWGDRDFDWHYILRTLQYKIKRTRKHVRHHHNYTEAQRDAEQMAEAERLIDVVMDDLNCSEYRAFCAKYPDRAVIGKRPDEEAKDLRLALNKQREFEDANWNKLFDHLKDNMRGWWD